MMLIRTIKPGKPFQSSIFRTEITREANSIYRDILDDFKRTTATWDHKVKFQGKVESGASVGGVKITVYTNDEIYGYVDLGTRKHVIRPKKKGYPLRFKVGGTPKTEPNVILSTPGSQGKDEVRAMAVHHPGTKPRNFSKIIKQTYAKEFRQKMQAALDRAAHRANTNT